MRSNRLISAVAIVGLTILSTNAPALEPPINLSRAVHPIDGPADAVDHSGIPQGANTCPADNVGTLTNGGTIVGSTIGSTDDFVAGCSSVSGGRDKIFEFQIDLPGEWSFDTCTVAACWARRWRFMKKPATVAPVISSLVTATGVMFATTSPRWGRSYFRRTRTTLLSTA